MVSPSDMRIIQIDITNATVVQSSVCHNQRKGEENDQKTD